MSEAFTIYYCWQSDTPGNHGRYLIRDALDEAAARVSADTSVPFKMLVQSDTENLSGLCDIPDTILQRLRESDAVVADLTYVAKMGQGDDAKFCSNPNVLFELGYAFKSIGPDRLICVMNERHGPADKQIFDLAHRRYPIRFDSPHEERTRREMVIELAKELEQAIRAVAKLGPSGTTGSDDEIHHEQQLDRIRDYWSRRGTHQQVGPVVEFVFRPNSFRDHRWRDAEALEEVVRKQAVWDGRHPYPPQPTGTAPMDWGIFNDTYGDPWALTYGGQYWTEFSVAGDVELQLSRRDSRLSPEPPPSQQVQADQWVPALHALPSIGLAFQFAQGLCGHLSEHESVGWTARASGLEGTWMSFGMHSDSKGPCRAPDVELAGSTTAAEFQETWAERCIDFAKKFSDCFCRDGRNVSRETLEARVFPNRLRNS